MIKGLRLKDILLLLLITVIVVLTLTPLFLMFYTSSKPAGTLTKKPENIMLADFNAGDMRNSLGDGVVIKSEYPSSITLGYKEDSDLSGKGRVLKVEYLADGRFPAAWQTKLSQDMRKLLTLEFFLKIENPLSGAYISLEDTYGYKTAIPLGRYLKSGAAGIWQKVVIPVKDFKIQRLNKGLPEKIAEDLIFEFREGRGSFYIDDINLRLKRFTIANYEDVLTSSSFGRYFFNSAFIAVMVTLGNMFFCALVGYVFARKNFPFKNTMFFLILAGIMIPPQVLMIPMFILMKNIGWLNSYRALIIPALIQPFNVFLMRQYISKLPVSLEDSARVDGATDMQIFFKIIMPLSKPALAVVGINTFMGSWNTFLFPFILTNTPQMRTLPVGLALFNSLQGAGWVHLMAGSGLTALPVIIVFLVFQRHIIAGLTSGAVSRH